MNCKLLACLGTAALLLAPAARAAVFCVGDATELQNALNTADSNGVDDTIRIKPGTYSVGNADVDVAFTYSTSQNNALTLSGGWFDSGMFECVSPAGDPTDTVLTGNNLRRVLQMSGAAGSTGAIAVQKLTIRDGNSEFNGGLVLGGVAGFAGNLLVDRVYFVSNSATETTGAAAISTDGTVTIRNSWIDNNNAGENIGGVLVRVDHTNSTETRAFVANNTVTGNYCTGASCVTGGLSVTGTARFAIFNNAFYITSDAEIRLAATSVLFNNFVQALDGDPIASGGNINPVSPGFVNAGAEDFRLLSTSPLVNAGTDDFDTDAFDPGTFDFDGNPRVNDGQYDIGAFENQNAVFKDGFEDAL